MTLKEIFTVVTSYIANALNSRVCCPPPALVFKVFLNFYKPLMALIPLDVESLQV